MTRVTNAQVTLEYIIMALLYEILRCVKTCSVTGITGTLYTHRMWIVMSEKLQDGHEQSNVNLLIVTLSQKPK